MDNYHEIDGDGDKGIVEILKEAYSNPKKRKFYNTMLQKADLNILEYRPVVEDRIVPNDFRERIQKGKYSREDEKCSVEANLRFHHILESFGQW